MNIKYIFIVVLLFSVFGIRSEEFKLVKTLHNIDTWDLRLEGGGISINPEEKYLSSVNRDGILTIYSIPDFKIFKTLDGPYNKPLCFSPNSSYFSCVSHKDNQGLIYRFPSFQLIKAIDCPSYTMYTNFSKNEKYMEITRDNITTELYSLPDFELVRTFIDSDDVLWPYPRRRRAYSGNGKYLATLQKHKINNNDIAVIFSREDNKVYHVIQEIIEFKSEIPCRLFFSPDEKYLAVETEDLEPVESIKPDSFKRIGPVIKASNLKIYSMPEIKIIRNITGNSGLAPSIFSPDGKYYVSVQQQDNIVKIYSLPEFKLFKAITDHTDIVTGIYFSENAQYFTIAIQDGTVNIYTITTKP